MTLTPRSSTAFGDADAADVLDGLDDTGLDALGFGVIAMDADGIVVAYNAFEGERSGLGSERMVGRPLLTEVAPCMNNFLVGQRFTDAAEQGQDLDEELDYVFTLRMRPTPVRLRLLARAGSPRRYVLVRNR